MKVLETKLDEILVKKAPYQLPDGFKKGLVKALPWLSLIGGLLTLWGAWSLYQLTMFASEWAGLANSLGTTYGYYNSYVGGFGPILWVSLLLLVVEAVVFIAAFSPLKAHKKRGWDLLFWVSLVNVAYAVVNLFVAPNLMQFLFSLLSSVIGLYILFQVRSYYSGAATAAAK